jgi:predicted metal-dependent hydrolase
VSGLQAAFDRADELGAAGRFFDAHEELESLWMKATGEEKLLLQGLIQIAAGLHRFKLDPAKTEGAFYLLQRGLAKLRKTEQLLAPGSLAPLAAAVGRIRSTRKAPAALAFGLKAA